ncbi:MAG: hypothetical protein ACRYFR_13385 [Janthinobacterium lividum]
MSEAEILAALGQAAGRTCGRFRAEQLARPLLPLAALLLRGVKTSSVDFPKLFRPEKPFPGV